MNPKRLFTHIVSILFLWLSAIAADAQFTVRTIYFQPQGTLNKTAEIRKIMADVHDYFGREMQRNGFGLKTFKTHDP